MRADGGFIASVPGCQWLEQVPGESWQFNEQNILWAIAERIGTGSGRFAEVGAGDGDRLPVTLDPFYKQAYRFHLWEANAENHAGLAAKYPGARIFGACESLADSEYGDGYVVIDVDGIDWYLFASLLQTKHLPRVVMVEHADKHMNLPDNPLSIAGSRAGKQATASQIMELSKGLMTLIGTTRVNSIFVCNDLLEKLFDT